MVVGGPGVLATGNTNSKARVDWKEIEMSQGRGDFVCVLGDEMERGEVGQFMTMKGKLIITRFGFLSGQHEEVAGSECWRRE